MRCFLHVTRCFGLATALLLAACGGGGGSASSGGGAPSPDAPTDLKVSIYRPLAFLSFTWTRPGQVFDGYEFEIKVGSGAYSKLNQAMIPSTWDQSALDMSLSARELETYTFRMRAMRGASASPYSNEASIRIPMTSPTINAYLGQGSTSVIWSNGSAVADTLKLERGVVEGATTTWTYIPAVTFGTTSWVDTFPPENVNCTYRVTYSKGQDSVSAASYPIFTPLAVPGQPVAIPLVEGVQLSWTNPSLVATEVAIMRASGLNAYPTYQQVAVVPAGATSYRDQPLAAGYYTYRLENRKAGIPSTHSSPTQVVSLGPQNGVSISPTILELPQADIIRRSSQGTWVLGGTYRSDVQVREPAGSGWTTFTPNSAQAWCSPFFLLDSHDQPHLIYTRQVVQGSPEVALMHAWKQDAAWQVEEIARRTLYLASSAMDGFTFELDVSDRLHLVWLKANGTAADLEYAIKGADGTWTIETPTNITTASPLGKYKLAVDPTGQAHLFIGAWQELYHLTRTTGTWTLESIPAPGVSVTWSDRMDCAAMAPDTCAVLVTRPRQPFDGTSDLLMVRKDAGTWLASEVVFNSVASGSFQVTLTPNKSGTRLALYHKSSTAGVLRVWGMGTWSSSIVGPSSYGLPLLGFNPADKIYLLLPAGSGDGSSSHPYVLYTEAP